MPWDAIIKNCRQPQAIALNGLRLFPQITSWSIRQRL